MIIATFRLALLATFAAERSARSSSRPLLESLMWLPVDKADRAWGACGGARRVS